MLIDLSSRVLSNVNFVYYKSVLVLKDSIVVVVDMQTKNWFEHNQIYAHHMFLAPHNVT